MNGTCGDNQHNPIQFTGGVLCEVLPYPNLCMHKLWLYEGCILKELIHVLIRLLKHELNN